MGGGVHLAEWFPPHFLQDKDPGFQNMEGFPHELLKGMVPKRRLYNKNPPEPQNGLFNRAIKFLPLTGQRIIRTSLVKKTFRF